MKLSDKIVGLRKSHGMSQEQLAEKLDLSRQAISRWELGTAMPDAVNILRLSKLFGVTADYLLNEEYESDGDLPKIKKIQEDHSQQILIALLTLEVMTLLIQFMATFILQNLIFEFLSFLLFAASIGGFEYGYQKRASQANEMTVRFRKRFYKLSAWLGLYFPIRFLSAMLMTCYPRPYSALAFECVVLILYLGASLCVTLSIEEKDLLRRKSE